MKQNYVLLIALLSMSSCIFQAYGQDIFFPGETERPERFPLHTTPGQRPTTNPNNPIDPNNSNKIVNPNNPNNPNNPAGTTQEQYNACVKRCRFTPEYNPVCGSDGVKYQNIGAFNCAMNCGNPIQNLGPAPCTTSTASTTTTATVTRPMMTQQQYNACVNDCRFTSEYNPVCGSDGVTYHNIGAFNCAMGCGNPIQNLGRAPCAQYTTPSS